MTTKFKRYSINLDDDSHRRFKAMADDLAVSMSGLLRMMIKDAFQAKANTSNITQEKQNMT
jgi:hypothetical protein